MARVIIVCSLVLGVLLPGRVFSSPRPPLDRPNVIVVFLDDSGYGDYTHTGNPTIHTPHISRLVREGALFPQFYVPSPACSASRYALLTGRSPQRSGLNRWVIGPRTERHLHPREITIAEGLKSRGYATALFGKWHLGTPNPQNQQSVDSLPLAHGFDTWYGTDVSHDYDDSRLIRSSSSGRTPVVGYDLVAAGLTVQPDVCRELTSRYVEEAVRFIREKRDQPFFIYLAHNMPHLGLYVSEAFDGTSRRGLLGDVMAEIDHGVGRIREELEAQGLAGNTLIIFSSDNGPWIRFHDAADHPKYGEARLRIGYATPFRDGKGSTWEGGVRVPGIFCWPGVIASGKIEYAPASTLDVLPTLFHLAGVPLPSGRILDGRNIAPYLAADRFPGSVEEFVFAYTGPDTSTFALRRGPWKIHVKLTSQLQTNHGFEASRTQPLLFQLEQDLGERIDRAAEQPEVVRTLLDALAAHERSVREDTIFWDQ